MPEAPLEEEPALKATSPVELVPSATAGAVIACTEPVFQRLALEPNEIVRLRVGKKQVTARLRALSESDALRVAVSPQVRQRLALPPRARLHLRKNEDGSLEFGPFFGILARPIPRIPPYGEQNRDFRLHMAMGRRRYVPVYAFGPHDIDRRRGTVRARVYDETRRRWVRRTMPIPHVVWNRSYWPGPKNRALLARTLRRLKVRGSIPFNPGVGTKWQVYRLLYEDPALRAHVPHTERYTGLQTVLRFASRYRGVYMKPLWGGWGIGIMRIRRLGRNRFHVSRTIGRRGRNWSRVVSLAGLRAVVRGLVDGPYLVQQEIPLAQLNGRLCDIRVLAQRRADGAWGITGAVVRVGKPRSVISNLHGGGRAMELRRALSLLFSDAPERVEQVIRSLEELTLKVIDRVESRFGRFGEIGLDFGIDRQGHLWFIEVNSRPGRHSFRITSPDDVWLATSATPVEYARKLADFA